MKKIFLILIFTFSPFTLLAQEPAEISPTIKEFSRTMGINELIKNIMAQSRTSVLSTMADISKNFSSRYPNISVDQNVKLDEMLKIYADTIFNSIDTDHAAFIYTNVLASNLSESELKLANEYYSSKSGQNTLKVVAEAAGEMNKYMTHQVSDSMQMAIKNLTSEMRKLHQEIAENQ